MLKRVSIQNFKSLKDVTLNLQKVNLLIGPNNSGKSNFLKALEFIASNRKHQNGLFTMPDNIVFRNIDLDYPEFVNIRLSFIDQPSSKVRHFGLFQNRTDVYQLRSWNKDIDENAVIKSLSNTDTNQYIFKESFLENTIIYRIDSNKLITSYPLLPNNNYINQDGSNLIAFLDNIRDEYPEVFYKIQTDLKICLQEFSQIRFENVEPTEEQKKLFGDKTYKRLGLYEVNLKTNFWADEISEGTLYFLAILCVIHQPNPPKLLLLEEPEKGIHPRRIEEVVNLILTLSEEKDVQVIMTTHSSIVVDMFKDMPESVFIFDKDDEGATHVKNLQKDIIEPETAESERLGLDPPQYLNGLGQAWKVGLIGGIPR